MTRSELIARIAERFPVFMHADAEAVMTKILIGMAQTPRRQNKKPAA